MENQEDNYQVEYDSATATVICQGSFHHCGEDGYQSLVKVFDEVIDQAPKTITLQLQELQFLNHEGTSALLRFVQKVRAIKKSQLLVHANFQSPWQIKTLKNLQRLMPGMIVELERS